MNFTRRQVKNKLKENEKFRDELLSMINETMPAIDRSFPFDHLQIRSKYILNMLNGKEAFYDDMVSNYIYLMKDVEKDLSCVSDIQVPFQEESYNQRAIKNIQLINGCLCMISYALEKDISVSAAYLEMKFNNAA
ncbi:hypothetical protein ACOZ9A_001597 [Vibrio parahaemolyticus]